MKKSIYLLIIMTALMLTGCSKKEQMTSFIPTQTPEEEATSDDSSQESSEEATASDTETTASDTESAATPTPGMVPIGATTKMYVKLDEYGGYLNVRSNPSTDGEAVGFLVHAEEVDVIETKDGWASIAYEDKVCYVNADFLVEERPEYLTPPPPTPSPVATPTPEPAKESEPNTEPDSGTVKPEI